MPNQDKWGKCDDSTILELGNKKFNFQNTHGFDLLDIHFY